MLFLAQYPKEITASTDTNRLGSRWESIPLWGGLVHHRSLGDNPNEWSISGPHWFITPWYLTVSDSIAYSLYCFNRLWPHLPHLLHLRYSEPSWKFMVCHDIVFMTKSDNIHYSLADGCWFARPRFPYYNIIIVNYLQNAKPPGSNPVSSWLGTQKLEVGSCFNQFIGYPQSNILQ